MHGHFTGLPQKKTEDAWDSLVSKSEKEEADRSGGHSLGEETCTASLDSILHKTKEDGGAMNEMVETMALLGPEEREKMLQWYGETMPKKRGFCMSGGWWNGELRRHTK